MASKCKGPGYASPLDAMKYGPKEKLLYVICVQPNENEPHGDYLSTVDVDPDSPTFCQVIHRTYTNKKGNELHHFGWNACSSCHLVPESCKNIPKRNKLILPSLNSDNIYIVDVGTDPLKPKIIKEISGDVLKQNNVTAPHTIHCLADGNIMISTMGDKDGKAKGDFILFDPDFNCIGTWTKGKTAYCGYDFWYQPYFNVMVASEWGAPNIFRKGFKPTDTDDDTQYGRRLNFYKWNERTLYQTIDLGTDGITPLEIRFLHNPKEAQGFVGTALHSKVFWFYKKPHSEEFEVQKVIDIPDKKVEGWELPECGGMMSDILISLDDRFLYLSNWLHGDIRQYNITDPSKPKLVGQIFLGGSVLSDSGVKVIEDLELTEQPKPTIIKGHRLEGAPQMLQLSLDGKRLYASTSLFSPWDKQFYPKMVKTGGTIVQIDCNIDDGGLKLNENFLVSFGNEPFGPVLPHEMRYPGGDCTSDIWLVNN